MKKLFVLLAFALTAYSAAPAQEPINVGSFYSSLGTQGEWITVDGGTYAWRPDGVAPDWRPYYDGQWVWTDDGWYWQSEEPWAWATYHYGRWYHDDYYGWCWIPGYEWAPAWVEWRYGGTAVGWAPLGPYAVFSTSWGIHYRRYWATPSYWWSFAECGYMGRPHMGQYIYRSDENNRFIGRTRTAGSVRYDNGRILTRGPERDYVETRGNVRVPRMDMVDVRERGQVGIIREGGQERVGVYRPRINEGGRDAVVRPDRVTGANRPIGIDGRGTDVMRRQVDREVGRDVQRTDALRQQREAPRERTVAPPARDQRQVAPDARINRSSPPQNIDRGTPRGERRVERQDRGGRQYTAPPQSSPGRREAPRMGSERPASRGNGGGTRSESPRGGGGGNRGGREGGGRR